jgi:hypothetical protein
LPVELHDSRAHKRRLGQPDLDRSRRRIELQRLRGRAERQRLDDNGFGQRRHGRHAYGFRLAAGANTVAFTNTYTAQTSSSVPDPTAGGWQLNGSSTLSATELALTAATSHQAGSAFWPQAIDPRNMTVEYEATIGGGSGADGFAFVLGDATRGALPTSLGVEGGGLGFSGIPGIAVALDEYKGTGAPSNNFAGVTDGPTSTTVPDVLHWLSTANLALPLQNATNKIKITTTNGTTLTVSYNGTQVLSQAVSLPSSAYLGFSGGTGGANNRHAVAHVVVSGT